MRMLKKILLATAATALLAAPLLESASAAEMKHDPAATAAESGDPAAAGYQAAMNKMHGEMMAMHYTGNADVDFVRAMIPHHRAAVDMATVLLDYGKDPQLRKMAHDIITTQTKEIAQMENWLAAHQAKN